MFVVFLLNDRHSGGVWLRASFKCSISDDRSESHVTIQWTLVVLYNYSSCTGCIACIYVIITLVATGFSLGFF